MRAVNGRMPPNLGRRRFIAGAGAFGLGAVILGACGGDDDSSSSAGGDSGGGDGAERYIVPAFPDGFRSPAILVAGFPARAPLVVTDGTGPLTSGAPAEIQVTLSHEGSIVDELTLPRHGEGLAVPYYPLTFTPEEAGTYQALADFSDLPVEFRVVMPGETGVIQVGEPIRPLPTPTVADPLGVDPICTRTPDPCPLHEVTLEEAIAAPGPTVFYIGTPAFCQTAVCGPALELLLEALQDRPEVTAVHAEVYVDPYGEDFETRRHTQAIDVYGLDFEPQLVVADATGKVTAVLNATMDATEIAAALDTV